MPAFNVTANKPCGEVHESLPNSTEANPARERLEYIADNDGVESFLNFLDGNRESINAETIVRSLALLGGKVCLEVRHSGSTEYIWLTDEWDSLCSRAVTSDATERGPVQMDAADLQHRIDDGKPIEVRLSREVPVADSGVTA